MKAMVAVGGADFTPARQDLLKKEEIKGVFTALVTPFKETGEVDYDALRALVEFNIEEGVNGLVPVGTTGESPTLDNDEHDEVRQ